MRNRILHWRISVLLAMLFLFACGGGGGNGGPVTPSDSTCVFDSSNWDSCTFGP